MFLHNSLYIPFGIPDDTSTPARIVRDSGEYREWGIMLKLDFCNLVECVDRQERHISIRNQHVIGLPFEQFDRFHHSMAGSQALLLVCKMS